MHSLSITILVDNTPGPPRLGVEHGLSLWIEADDRRILFDTGQSDLVLRNATALGIDLRTADAVVISHGHYDHTGGLAAVMRLCVEAAIYCHTDVLVPRFSRQQDGAMKSIGMPHEAVDAVRRITDSVQWVCGPCELGDGIGVTGPIPRLAALEDTGGAFFLDAEGRRPDPIDDDLAMWFATPQGVVAVTGCCHAGLINTLTHIRALAGDAPVRAVIGGLHLLHASPDRIEATAGYLVSIGIEQLTPCHCTGGPAVAALEARLGGSVAAGKVGGSLRYC